MNTYIQMHSVSVPCSSTVQILSVCLYSLVTPSSRSSLLFFFILTHQMKKRVALVGGGGGEPVVLSGAAFLTRLTPRRRNRMPGLDAPTPPPPPSLHPAKHTLNVFVTLYTVLHSHVLTPSISVP